MIKAVLIDIDDTLLDFSLCAKSAMEESYKDFNLTFDDNMFPVFEAINAELWKQIEKNEIEKNDLYGRRWTTVLSQFGISNIDGNKFEEHFTEHLSEGAEKVVGAEDLLKYLFSKYKIYAASNGPHSQQLKRLKKAGLLQYFADVFTSELLGFQKPEKAFFELCLTRTDARAVNECVLIGDSLTADISGGKNLGMKTIWFNKKATNEPLEICPDYTVTTLAEIKNII